MRIFLTWDDGSVYDTKLFDLHRKYNIPGMFFVPTNNSEGRDVISAECISQNASDLISFGGHTYSHVFLDSISACEVENEIVLNKKYLENILHTEVTHFCLPGGKYNKYILKIVFKYFKTCRTADTMNVYNKSYLFKPAFHFYHRSYKSILLNSLRHHNLSFFFWNVFHPRLDYFERIKKIIAKYSSKSMDIIIWGHSWEIEENGLWPVLEDLFQYIKENFREKIYKYDEIILKEKK